MPTIANNQKNIEKTTKSGKKKQALKMLASKEYTKSDISRILGIDRGTIYSWINEKNNEINNLNTNDKVSLWQRESIKDSYAAGLARDLLVQQLESSPDSVSTSEKRSIAYAMSITSATKADKARDEELGKRAYPAGIQVNIQVVGATGSGSQDTVVSATERVVGDNKLLALINKDKTCE